MIEKRGKRCFRALTIAFLILNILIGVASNCYFIGEILKRDYYMTVELHSNVKRDQIKELEKKLLEKNSVVGVKYLSKDQAFRELQRELEIVIPKNDNQLPNSFVVTFKSEKDFKEIQTFLDKTKIVREIYVDEPYVIKVDKKVQILNILVGIIGGMILLLFYLIVVILKDSIALDYISLNLTNGENRNNYKIARTKNCIVLFGSFILATLIFFNIYIFLRERIQFLMNDLILQSFNQLLLSEAVVLGLIVLFAIRFTKNYRVDEV